MNASVMRTDKEKYNAIGIYDLKNMSGIERLPVNKFQQHVNNLINNNKIRKSSVIYSL